MTKRLSFEVIFARRLFEQLHNNIEPFDEQEFPNLVAALKRMRIPLTEMRKETFVLWSFAFHLMLNNSALQARGDLAIISQGFDALCSDFVTLHQEYGGDPKDFFTRRLRYETSVSQHLKSDPAGSNISEPILKVIFPVLMAHASEEILYDDATTLRRTVDKNIESFLELCGVCVEDMRKAKLIDSTL